MMKLPFALAILLGASGVCPAQTAMLLTQEQFEPSHVLPPPPAPGSARAQAELAELRTEQAASTPEQIAAAAYDDRHEDGTIFADAIGPDLGRLPATKTMIATIIATEDKAAAVAKKQFHRDRPYIVDPTIRTCTPHKDGPAANSYPSGHATLGFSIGIVLASMMPEKSQAILQRAEQYAEHRLVCGYHFRSDIVAGQQFGTLLAIRLLQNAQFQSEMAASEAELREAHILQ